MHSRFTQPALELLLLWTEGQCNCHHMLREEQSDHLLIKQVIATHPPLFFDHLVLRLNFASDLIIETGIFM